MAQPKFGLKGCVRTRINNKWRFDVLRKLSKLGIYKSQIDSNQTRIVDLEKLIEEYNIDVPKLVDLYEIEKQNFQSRKEQLSTKETKQEITKNQIPTLSNKEWRNLAKKELTNIGISFAKTVTNLVLEQKIIQNEIKNVPAWTSKKSTAKKLSTTASKVTIPVQKSPVPESSNPHPIGYISRCRQDESINLDPEVFYKSWRWKELRLIVLDNCGRRCCSCGATPRPDNQVVLHVDHIKPLRNYPQFALDIANLQVLCEDCNQGKSWYQSNDYRTDAQINKLASKKEDSQRLQGKLQK